MKKQKKAQDKMYRESAEENSLSEAQLLNQIVRGTLRPSFIWPFSAFLLQLIQPPPTTTSPS